MTRHFLVFGIHPELSFREAQAVMGCSPTLVEPVALVDDYTSWQGEWLQERLAGTIKLGDVLFTCSLKELTAEKIVGALPAREGTSKLTFAVTTYGSGGALKRLPIELKKALREGGRSVRWFADKAGQVSPAAVAKLGLTTEGYDIVIVIDRDVAHVGITTHVQDADAWSLRDYGRPVRDARNGMLPPKLARMMVNLGVGATSPSPSLRQAQGRLLVRRGTSESDPPPYQEGVKASEHSFDGGFGRTILDPFCGSGTVLMEAALLDQRAKIIGADIDERQVAGCLRNLDWMVDQRLISSERRSRITCFAHDVRTIQAAIHEPVELVVTEGFLGAPLQGHETSLQLERETRAITELWREALEAMAKIQPAGGVVVAVWPILKTTHGEARVDVTPFLDELGYELVEATGSNKPLVYARADQRVQRRIVVLQKRETGS